MAPNEIPKSDANTANIAQKEKPLKKPSVVKSNLSNKTKYTPMSPIIKPIHCFLDTLS